MTRQPSIRRRSAGYAGFARHAPTANRCVAASFFRRTIFTAAVVVSGFGPFAPAVAAVTFGEPQLVLFGGTFQDDPETEVDGAALGVGVRAPLRGTAPNLSLGLEVWGWSADQPNDAIRACLVCSVDDEVDVSVTTVNTNLAIAYPAEGRVQVYALGGIGISRIKYELSGSVIGIPGTVEDDADTALGTHYGVGASFTDGRTSIGLTARHYDIESRSEDFGIPDIDVGGDFVGISIGYIWR